MVEGIRTDRRSFLKTAGAGATVFALAACTPAAAPGGGVTAGSAAPTTDAAWKQELDRLVAAAKQEGALSLALRAGEGYRKWVEAFEQQYPDIAVAQKSYTSVTLFQPQVDEERKAGIYSYDVVNLAPGRTTHTVLVPGRVFDPIKPVIFHPEAIDEKKWIGGFEYGFVDQEKQYVFGFGWENVQNLWINTDLVKEGEVKGARNLLDPKWKGRMIFTAYNTGNTYGVAVGIMKHFADADEMLRKLFVEQQPVYARDTRQITEALIRGQYAIAIGPSRTILQPFLAAGVGRNVKALDLPELRSLNMEAIYLYNRAPHPNAAKLFINWTLTREGQTAFTQQTQIPSRRTDVPVPDPADYPSTNIEEINRTWFNFSLWNNQDLPVEAVNKLQKLVS